MAESKNPQQNAENKDQQHNSELEALRAQLAAIQAEMAEAEARASRAEESAAEKELALKVALDKADVAARKQEAAAARQLRTQDKVWLTINSSANDSTAVAVSVNGYAYRIKRDKRALVPRAVAEALKLASMDVPMVEKMPDGNQRTVFKHGNRFAFSVEEAEPGAVAEDD